MQQEIDSLRSQLKQSNAAVEAERRAKLAVEQKCEGIIAEHEKLRIKLRQMQEAMRAQCMQLDAELARQREAADRERENYRRKIRWAAAHLSSLLVQLPSFVGGSLPSFMAVCH